MFRLFASGLLLLSISSVCLGQATNRDDQIRFRKQSLEAREVFQRAGLALNCSTFNGMDPQVVFYMQGAPPTIMTGNVEFRFSKDNPAMRPFYRACQKYKKHVVVGYQTNPFPKNPSLCERMMGISNIKVADAPNININNKFENTETSVGFLVNPNVLPGGNATASQTLRTAFAFYHRSNKGTYNPASNGAIAFGKCKGDGLLRESGRVQTATAIAKSPTGAELRGSGAADVYMNVYNPWCSGDISQITRGSARFPAVPITFSIPSYFNGATANPDGSYAQNDCSCTYNANGTLNCASVGGSNSNLDVGSDAGVIPSSGL